MLNTPYSILNPGEYLTVVMSGAAATTNPKYSAIWRRAPAQEYNQPVGSLSGATAVTIVDAPNQHQRIVDSVDIYNADTASVTITISKVTAAGTSNTLTQATIASGSTLHVDGLGRLTFAGSVSGLGAAAGTGNVASELGYGPVQQTLLTFTDMTITVTDALAYASQKVYDFPEGRILVLGVTANLQWGVTTDRTASTGTINDNASLTWSIGTVAASNVSLTSTMVDLCPSTTKVLSAATTAYNTASAAALAASAQFDGTSTAKDAIMNVSFVTTTDIDNDGTLKVSGTVLMTWLNLGDY